MRFFVLVFFFFFALILTCSTHPSPGVFGLWELSGKLTDCKQLEMLSLFFPIMYQENPVNYRWKGVFKVSIFKWFFWVYFTSWYTSVVIYFFKAYIAYSKIYLFGVLYKPTKESLFFCLYSWATLDNDIISTLKLLPGVSSWQKEK